MRVARIYRAFAGVEVTGIRIVDVGITRQKVRHVDREAVHHAKPTVAQHRDRIA